MEIDELIKILKHAKDVEGLTNVNILRKEDGRDGVVYIESIESYCYEFDTDSLILIPLYL